MKKSWKKAGGNFHYLKLADNIMEQIHQGTFKPGDKLPSLRQMKEQTGRSISTVHQAYIELENRGIVESRVKSGFYVKAMLHDLLPAPAKEEIKSKPKRYTRSGQVRSIVNEMRNPSLLQMGGASASTELMPSKQLSRIIKTMPLLQIADSIENFEDPDGCYELRHQIARRMLNDSLQVTEGDIITTNGCLESICLALRAVGNKGDTNLVASPVFHGFLQQIEDLGMYALEVPADSENGIDLENLEKALDKNQVKACIFTPNFEIPLGYQVSDENKRKVFDLVNSRGIAIIEDDIYGDLYFENKRPITLKSFDQDGSVIYCSSFSKTLPTGLRVGWIVPGKYKEKVRSLKFNTYITSARLNQLVIAEFIKSRYYDMHLKNLRNALKNQVTLVSNAIAENFPAGTKITAPKGGFIIWVQLPENTDGVQVYEEALKEKIAIVPGIICSTTDRYRNCLRLNFGYPWTEKLEQGIKTLAKICHRLVKK